jgi:hypothetical protein
MPSMLAKLKAAGTRVDGLALGRDGGVSFIATGAGAWSESEKAAVHAALGITTTVPTSAQQQARLAGEIQSWLDRTAQGFGYDNIATAISYAGSSLDLWRRQGVAFAAWRDAVWQAACPLIENPAQLAMRAAAVIALLPQPNIPST